MNPFEEPLSEEFEEAVSAVLAERREAQLDELRAVVEQANDPTARADISGSTLGGASDDLTALRLSASGLEPVRPSVPLQSGEHPFVFATFTPPYHGIWPLLATQPEETRDHAGHLVGYKIVSRMGGYFEFFCAERSIHPAVAELHHQIRVAPQTWLFPPDDVTALAISARWRISGDTEISGRGYAALSCDLSLIEVRPYAESFEVEFAHEIFVLHSNLEFAAQWSHSLDEWLHLVWDSPRSGLFVIYLTASLSAWGADGTASANFSRLGHLWPHRGRPHIAVPEVRLGWCAGS